MSKFITYQQSGVDIGANDEMVEKISSAVRSTHGPRVIHLHNAFAGLFRLDYNEKLFKKNYRDPVLVACTDGVGSKIQLASMVGRFDTVGIDLVAMSVNDMLVQGAEPLFFLDYIAVNQLDPEWVRQTVEGICEGCRLAGCALLGGETAEMGSVYRKGEFDLAGFAVGVVERKRMITGGHVEAGDQVIGLASSGVHSNGYSLVRHVCFEKNKLKVNQHVNELGEELGAALLRPTRIYTKSIIRVLGHYRVKQVIKAMAHITGGGLVGNIPRVIGRQCDVTLYSKRWEIPPVFGYLQGLGPIEEEEMYRVFNMGIGFVLIVRPAFTESILGQLRKSGEKAYLIGEVKSGTGKVTIK